MESNSPIMAAKQDGRSTSPNRVNKKGMVKELMLKRTKDGMYFTFYFEGGGEVPKQLQGLFDAHHAQSVKEAYLSERG
jgi:hypothetical protein